MSRELGVVVWQNLWTAEGLGHDRSVARPSVAVFDRCGAAAFSLCLAIGVDAETAANIVYECASHAPIGTSDEAVLAEVRAMALAALPPTLDADTAQVGSRLLRAYDMLDTEQRRVVGLIYYRGLDVAGVATRLGLSAAHVMSVLTEALNRIRDASIAIVTAETEICLESLDRHRHALQMALRRGTRVVCVDLTDTRLFGSDGIRFLGEAAASCAALELQLRVLTNAHVRRILDLVGLRDPSDWPAMCRAQAAAQPTRTSQPAFDHAVNTMTPHQLEQARRACWTTYHATKRSADRRTSQQRLATVARQQRTRQRDAGPAETGIRAITADAARNGDMAQPPIGEALESS